MQGGWERAINTQSMSEDPSPTIPILRMKEGLTRRAGIERKLASRADKRVSRYFGHVERMDEYRMARRVLVAEVSGGWV